MPCGTGISSAEGLPINPALKAAVLSACHPATTGAESWEKSECPQLTPASSTRLAFHAFPRESQNNFFVLEFWRVHCWGERKFIFLPLGPEALVSKGEVLFCSRSSLLSPFPTTHRSGTWCKEMWRVPVLPTQVGRVECMLPLAVGTPVGVSESCSSPSTILGIRAAGRCLAPSPGAAPGLKAVLLKQPEAYVSLIFCQSQPFFPVRRQQVANPGGMPCPWCEKILWIPEPELSAVCVKSLQVGR